MVVDDEPFNIMAVKGMMRVLKFDYRDLVDSCRNGEEAVRLMEKAIEDNDVNRYGLILTDISMPFMDGYESSKRMRQIRQQELRNQITQHQDKLVIIAVTGHAEPHYIKKAE